jgi:hypothetical protein
MSDIPPPLDLPFDQAAVLYLTTLSVLGRMQDSDIDERGYGATLPRGVLTCGEAMALMPLVMILLVGVYPQLLDQDALESALRTAVLPSQTLQ